MAIRAMRPSSLAHRGVGTSHGVAPLSVVRHAQVQRAVSRRVVLVQASSSTPYGQNPGDVSRNPNLTPVDPLTGRTGPPGSQSGEGGSGRFGGQLGGSGGAGGGGFGDWGKNGPNPGQPGGWDWNKILMWAAGLALAIPLWGFLQENVFNTSTTRRVAKDAEDTWDTAKHKGADARDTVAGAIAGTAGDTKDAVVHKGQEVKRGFFGRLTGAKDAVEEGVEAVGHRAEELGDKGRALGHRAGHRAEEGVEQGKAQLQHTGHRVQETAESARISGKHAAHHAQEGAREAADTAKEKTSGFFSPVVDAVGNVKDRMTSAAEGTASKVEHGGRNTRRWIEDHVEEDKAKHGPWTRESLYWSAGGVAAGALVLAALYAYDQKKGGKGDDLGPKKPTVHRNAPKAEGPTIKTGP